MNCIRNGLTRPISKTWEKTIYHLLIKYRNKHLENYNMEEEEYAEARERRQARKQSQSSSSPARRKGVPAQDHSARLAPLGENETVANTPVKRPQAPTPNKASRKAPPELPTPTKPVSQARGPAGPRPPNSRGNSGTSNSSQAPAIVLQGATPTKELPPPQATSSRPGSEVITTPTSPTPLNVPRVEDANLQTFLNQIADQMNRFSVRSSVASHSSTSSSAVLGSDYQACLAFAAGLTPSANLPSPVTENVIEEQGQFEDAADDQTDAEIASIHSSFTASIAPQSPLAGLGLGAPSATVRPGLHPVAGPNQQRWSYASSAGSSYRGSSAGSYAPVESPQFTYSPLEVQAPVLQAERSAPLPPPRATRPAPPISRPLPLNPAQQAYSEPTESLLPRDTSYVIIENSELPSDASLSSWGSKSSGFKAHRGLDGFGMLKKKKLSVEPVPFSSDSLGSSATSPFNSPKRSWFNNLFNFKPATCTLLSKDNLASTRERVRKILLSIGVRTAVTEIDGHKALKCRLDEVRDNGNVATKGVRFRVEFARANTSQTYSTLVTLTQEKGAESSFRGKLTFIVMKRILTRRYLTACFVELKHFMDSQPSTPTTLSLNRPSVEQSRSVNSSNLLPAHSYQQHRYSATSADAPAGAPTSPLLSAPPIRYTASAPTTPVIDSSPRFTSPYLQLPVSPQSLQMPSY